MKRWLGIVLAICLAAMPVNTYANNEQTLPTEISGEAAVNETETEAEESEEETAEETEESQSEKSEEESIEETEESQLVEVPEDVRTGLEEFSEGELEIEASASNATGNMLVDESWTLTTDTIITGSLTIDDSVWVDLNGYALTVKGNLIQQGGNIIVNRGSLNVSGDFIQEEGYESYLEMQNTNDTVVIGGSYKTYSTGRSFNFTTGTLRIAGDLIVGAGREENFHSGENLQVILTGNGSHQISFLETNSSYIGNLTVESGKITVNETLSIGKLNSDLEITSYSGKSFSLRQLNAGGHTVSVPGDVITPGYWIDLAGGKLIVNGNLIQQGGYIIVNKGSLNVSGDFIQEEGYESYLEMQNTNDTVVIGGSYKTCSTARSAIFDMGTLRIAGDLLAGVGREENFHSGENLQVILTGDGSHQISFLEENNSYIGNLTVESGKITANETLSIGKLNSDLEITGYSGKSFTLRQLNANGHTVSVPGGVVTTGDIDLAGGKLAVNGNLTQQGGNINVNKGVLTVSGDFVQKEGYGSLLTMQNTNDTVRVEGNYTTYSTASHSGSLSAGELTVNGNFTQGQGSSASFYATGSHITHLTGEQLQTVVFTPEDNGQYLSGFNILEVNKDLNTGYRFTPDKCWNRLISPTPTPTPTSTPTPTPIPTPGPVVEDEAKTNVNNFVSRMYTVVLSRASEPAGQEYWVDRLLTHDTDGAGIAHGFIMSGEFERRNLTDREYVDVLYRTFFNREEAPEEQAYWLAKLKAGNSRGYVLSGFVNSREFDELCDSYGIIRGKMKEDGIPYNAGIRPFVERQYTKVLNRAGEKAGMEYWTEEIVSGRQTPEDVAKRFFQSDEFIKRGLSDSDYVEVLYETFLDRPSEPDGKAYWLKKISGGMDRGEVLEGFSKSPEFAEIVAGYGL